MVVDIREKRNFIMPIVLGLAFSMFYHLLPIKYFLLLIIGFIGATMIIYNVKLGLMIGAFLMPFLPDMISLLYMFALLGVFLFQRLAVGRHPLSFKEIEMPIVLFLLVMLISTFTSRNPGGSFRDLALHLGGLSFLFVMSNTVKDKESLNRIITVMVFSAFLVGLYGLYQYVVGVEVESAWLDVENNPGIRTRVYSVFNNPNILAEYLIMTIPLGISLFWFSKKLHKKIIFLGMSLVMSLSLIFTLSRGGWIGFAFSALIFILLVEKRLLLSLIPISIGGLYLLPQTILNRIMSIGNLGDSSNAYRIKIWEITGEIIKDNPIAGVGFGHIPFKETFETYIRTMPTFHAHNTYLQTAAEIGIPGLIAFLFFLFILFKYAIVNLVNSEDHYIRIMTAGVISGLGGVLVHGGVENILYLPRIIFTFWIMISFIVTLSKIHRGESI